MKARSSCPDPEILQALLDCKLAEQQQSQLLQHLEGCEDCQRDLERFDEDASLSVLAGHLQAPRAAADTVLKNVMDEVNSNSNAGASGDCQASVSLDFLSPTDNPDYIGRLGRYEIGELV